MYKPFLYACLIKSSPYFHTTGCTLPTRFLDLLTNVSTDIYFNPLFLSSFSCIFALPDTIYWFFHTPYPTRISGTNDSNIRTNASIVSSVKYVRSMPNDCKNKSTPPSAPPIIAIYCFTLSPSFVFLTLLFLLNRLPPYINTLTARLATLRTIVTTIPH